MKTKHKNPFRGIACHIPGQVAQFSRHVAGRRDGRARYKHQDALFDHEMCGLPLRHHDDAYPLQAIFTGKSSSPYDL